MAKPTKPPLRTMTVARKHELTPNMIRVSFKSDWIGDLSPGIEGAHCKLFFAAPGQSQAAFLAQLADGGPRPTVRTYTIRSFRSENCEIEIDFVDHGDAGPASAFARHCNAGDICGFGGPGPVKLAEFYADTYIVAADMSALPVAAATLEAMPRDATGFAFLEITDAADRQDIDAPDGIDMHWLVHPNPHEPPVQSVSLIRALPKLEGIVQTCIAGESSMIAALRREILVERAIPKQDAYIAGYWKIGLVEDQHQKMKRDEAASVA